MQMNAAASCASLATSVKDGVVPDLASDDDGVLPVGPIAPAFAALAASVVRAGKALDEEPADGKAVVDGGAVGGAAPASAAASADEDQDEDDLPTPDIVQTAYTALYEFARDCDAALVAGVPAWDPSPALGPAVWKALTVLPFRNDHDRLRRRLLLVLGWLLDRSGKDTASQQHLGLALTGIKTKASTGKDGTLYGATKRLSKWLLKPKPMVAAPQMDEVQRAVRLMIISPSLSQNVFEALLTAGDGTKRPRPRPPQERDRAPDADVIAFAAAWARGEGEAQLATVAPTAEEKKKGAKVKVVTVDALHAIVTRERARDSSLPRAMHADWVRGQTASAGQRAAKAAAAAAERARQSAEESVVAVTAAARTSEQAAAHLKTLLEELQRDHMAMQAARDVTAADLAAVTNAHATALQTVTAHARDLSATEEALAAQKLLAAELAAQLAAQKDRDSAKLLAAHKQAKENAAATAEHLRKLQRRAVELDAAREELVRAHELIAALKRQNEKHAEKLQENRSACSRADAARLFGLPGVRDNHHGVVERNAYGTLLSYVLPSMRRVLTASGSDASLARDKAVLGCAVEQVQAVEPRLRVMVTATNVEERRASAESATPTATAAAAAVEAAAAVGAVAAAAGFVPALPAAAAAASSAAAAPRPRAPAAAAAAAAAAATAAPAPRPRAAVDGASGEVRRVVANVKAAVASAKAAVTLYLPSTSECVQRAQREEQLAAGAKRKRNEKQAKPSSAPKKPRRQP